MFMFVAVHGSTLHATVGRTAGNAVFLLSVFSHSSFSYKYVLIGWIEASIYSGMLTLRHWIHHCILKQYEEVGADTVKVWY